MTTEQLSAIAGVILALAFSYIPGLNTWFAALQSEYKRLIMIGLMFITAGAAFGLSCAGLAPQLGINITCDQAGAITLVMAFIAAVVANQATYLITPDTKSVKKSIAKRDGVQLPQWDL